ncbi:carbohydrate ABC transporter permease [Paenibacillus radicis (ex Gao et al. 2016)]|uniref:Sugar ABC transporter permease n=1 Tax=Paenibacillus radicis (ex Gao et al. 2016) TaxID=1737354 RepID=A0A917GR71_9BACL|nr:carbohydrate ABC transporter permease [Paenibacillus radicis (ex Gao et al. 2016)]GGG54272.1 sugar ABC transporter permease [Paenibacillus radicis (ex Gao et al. 2016)]
MASASRAIKESKGDRIVMAVIYAILSIVLIVVLYPLLFVVSSSISSPAAVSSGQVWLWPVDISFKGYETLFKTPLVLRGYGNSLLYTAAGTFVSVMLTVMVAYPLSRKTIFGRNAIMMIITFTMVFSGGLIPTYMVVREMGLIDTRWALIIPNAIWVWQVIIARSFFHSSIPEELMEAAEIDGCSDIRFIWSIVLPLSKPVLAVLVLMYAVGQWNAYFDALIYLKDAKLFPLQLVLRSIIIQNNSSNITDALKQVERQQLAELLKYSLIVIATLPVLVIYPFVQRHFVQGLLVGSVKG